MDESVSSEKLSSLKQEVRSVIAAYRDGRLSLDRLSWRLESAVDAFEALKWSGYDSLWPVWEDIEAENAVSLDRGTPPDNALITELLESFESAVSRDERQ